MSEYGIVKSGKLKLKGNKSLFKSDRKRKRKPGDDDSIKVDPDVARHGGWRRISDQADLKGGTNVALEMEEGSSSCYLSAMDNGKFTLGAPHNDPEAPAPEEILTLIKTPDDTKISLKTGYGKFVGVDSNGHLIGTAEAIGARERMEFVFEQGKSALQAMSNSCFISMQPDSEGYIYASSRKAGPGEMITIRTDSEKTGPVDWRPGEDKKSARHCETAYVKMFQHSKVELKGKHISIDVNDKRSVKEAQSEGTLHEHLLDRRVKTKSDKYC